MFRNHTSFIQNISVITKFQRITIYNSIYKELQLGSKELHVDLQLDLLQLEKW